MSDWMMWAALAGVVVILELFTGTFYLLMIAIGMIAGAGAAWFGAAKAMQLIVAAIIGVIATVLLRRSRFGKFHRTDALRDPNVNLDIGQTIQIHSWNAGPDGHYSTRAMYRGAQWDVELEKGARPEPGQFVIREVRSNRLIVNHSHS